MAMRMPRKLRSDSRFETDEDSAQKVSLRSVKEPALIISWPTLTPDEQPEETPVAVTIRTKHFEGHTGSEVREYGAKVHARGTSPADLLRTLTSVIQDTPELTEAPPSGTPMILDIRLIAG